MENSNEVIRKDYDNDLIEAWQNFTLIPKPDLHGKTLNCSYVQVTLILNICWAQITQLPGRLHWKNFVSKFRWCGDPGSLPCCCQWRFSCDPWGRLRPECQHQVGTKNKNKGFKRYFNFLHSFKFEAQPKPTATWFVKGDQEISISVESDEQRRQNYVVYPLEKVII